MERNNMNTSTNSLKDLKKMEDFYWFYSNSNHSQQQPQSYGGEYLSGFSWPPRTYTCSFCKREFRSAQALGGHMNVHRRDRARLRISPPLPRDNNSDGQSSFLNLNPNPNFISTPPLVPPFSSFSSQSAASPSEMKKWGALNDPICPKDSIKKSAKSFSRAEELDGCKLTNKATEIVKLDLEIGLISDSKEDLDLELRLGYS